MPLLEDLLMKIFQQANARPDLGEEGKVATYAGRVVRPGDDVKSTLARQPQAETETGATAQMSPGLLKDALKLALAGSVTPQAWRALSPESKARLTKYYSAPGFFYKSGQKPEDYSLSMESILDSYGHRMAEFIKRPFRSLGLDRMSGDLRPDEYVELSKATPGYERYISKARSLVERVLGPEFNTYRGKNQLDPLFHYPVNTGELPTSTAASLDEKVARSFNRGVLAKLKATPQSVEGLLPRRSTSYATEKELVLNPQKVNEITLLPHYGMDPQADDQMLMQQVIDATLNKYRMPKSNGNFLKE